MPDNFPFVWRNRACVCWGGRRSTQARHGVDISEAFIKEIDTQGSMVNKTTEMLRLQVSRMTTTTTFLRANTALSFSRNSRSIRWAQQQSSWWLDRHRWYEQSKFTCGASRSSRELDLLNWSELHEIRWRLEMAVANHLFVYKRHQLRRWKTDVPLIVLSSDYKL